MPGDLAADQLTAADDTGVDQDRQHDTRRDPDRQHGSGVPADDQASYLLRIEIIIDTRKSYTLLFINFNTFYGIPGGTYRDRLACVQKMIPGGGKIQ